MIVISGWNSGDIDLPNQPDCGHCSSHHEIWPRTTFWPVIILSSHAFTYDVLAGSVIVQHQSTGTPLVWPTPPITIRLELGDAGRVLRNGTTSWDDNAASALAEWTAVVPLLVQQSDAPNVARWPGSRE